MTNSFHYPTIAALVIFCVPFLVRVAWRLRTAPSDYKTKTSAGFATIIKIVRWFLRDPIQLFCTFRIIGNALFLAAAPTNNLIIGAFILESMGFPALVGELTVILVALLERYADSPSQPPPIKYLRLALQYVRVPILIAILFFIVSYSLHDAPQTSAALVQAGAILLLAVYTAVLAAYVYTAPTYLTTTITTSVATGATRRDFILAALALPFLLVRVLYPVLGAFGVDGGGFALYTGDWRLFVAMDLAMEAVVLALLMASRMAWPWVHRARGGSEGPKMAALAESETGKAERLTRVGETEV
ncbi:hypothetical protein MBLNU459_g1238t1 [Dothideomycetes sp. NU459]